MIKLRLIILLSPLFTILSCHSIYEVPEVVYVIKAGAHSSNVQGSIPGNGLRSLKSETLTFSARFDESAIYNLGNADQEDVNKLFGFSDCNSSHLDNSARFGWAYNLNTEEVDIFAYVYISGKREILRLGSAQINETNTYSLSLVGDKFRFEFKDSVITLQRGSSCDIGLYYRLFPYFGGNQKAPHDIRIYIQEL